MSTFYIVLYFFIAVVALLCIVSFIMYLMNICGANPCDKPSSHNMFSRSAIYSPREESQPLNQTQLTNINEENNESVALVNMRHHSTPLKTNPESLHYQQKPDVHFRPSETSFNEQASAIPEHHQSMETTIPMETKPTQIVEPASPKVQNISPPVVPSSQPVILRSHVQPPPDRPSSDYLQRSLNKPPVPAKPIIHSLPSSKRNSLVRPDGPPPLPPSSLVTAQPVVQVSNRASISRSSISKPKAPPPPPPSFAVQPDSPPSYREVLYDTPQGGNYLTDED